MKKFILSAAVLLATTISANAADLLQPSPVNKQDFGLRGSSSGWYARADVGAAIFGNFGVASTADGPFTDVNLTTSVNLDLGVGYRWNKYFRTDITAGYVGPSQFTGAEPTIPVACDGTPGGTCTFSDEADLNVFTSLANLYLDLGTYGGLTPYIGGGVGAAYVSFTDYRSSSSCVGCAPGFVDTTFGLSGSGAWQFAYQLSAGVAYDLTDNFKIDASYRYLRVRDGIAVRQDDGLAGSFEYDDLSNHLFRLGLRYEFNG